MELPKAVDNLYLYDPQFQAGANTFLSDVGGSSAKHAIGKWDDVDAAIKGFSLVKQLIIDTHGVPGAVHLADGGRLEGIDFLLLRAKASFLAKNARILFLGCNIGEGPAGDQFLDEVGKYLLTGKGGIVGATTVTNVSFQLLGLASEAFMNPLHQSGKLKVRRYDEAGKLMASRSVNRHGAVR